MSYPYKMLKLLLAWSHQSFQRFSCRLSVGKQMRQPPRPRTCCHAPIYTYQGVSCSGSYWTSTKTTDLSAHHFGSLHPWSEAGALILLPVIMISLTPHPLGVGFCEFSVIQFIFWGPSVSCGVRVVLNEVGRVWDTEERTQRMEGAKGQLFTSWRITAF